MARERLDLSVALKLAFVEDSLSRVEECRHHLQENARKVKKEIHEVVDQQVGSLRMRERQLVRQVEVVTAHQACLLGTQQAGLMHSKGALTATSELLQRCSNTDTSTLSKIKVDEMECLKDVQPVKHVSVQLDDASLASAISEFGLVQLPDTITHHPSPVIPAKVEEYEDDDHDVLHKSVAGAASGPNDPVRITVQFPRLNHHTWLVNQSGTSADHCVPTKAQEELRPRSNDVASWLSNLQLVSAQDDEASQSSSSDGFDVVGTSSRASVSEGSSIEIVPLPQDFNKECSTSGTGVCEIENLHHLVGDKSCWLSSKSAPLENPQKEKLDITAVCQANEVCPSFNDCVCQNKCKDTALQKLQQTAEFKAKTSRKRCISECEGSYAILSHMANILSSENSQWLLEKHDHCELASPVKRIMYQAPADTWLRRGTNAPLKNSPRVRVSSHTSAWLLKNLKNQMIKNAQERDEKEKEKMVDEKESLITSEALSEALKRVHVSPPSGSRRQSVAEGNYLKSDLSSSFIDESWLLSKNVDSNKQVGRDKWHEKEEADLWLIGAPESSPLLKKYASKNLPGLPDSLLSLAHTDASNWLLS